MYYPKNHPDKNLAGKEITDQDHLKAAMSQDELQFKSEEEIRQMCASAQNVISFLTGVRLRRSDSFYKQTKDRILARQGKLFVATLPPEGPMAA